MLTEHEILNIAKSIIKKTKLKIKVKFLAYEKFLEEANKSPLIKKVLEEGNDFYDLNVPSIFSHKKDTIYFNKKILTKLLHDEPFSLQKRFIASITHHEIFHFLNKNKMKDLSLKSALKSEKRSERDFKKYFPSLAILGKTITKKNTDF